MRKVETHLARVLAEAVGDLGVTIVCSCTRVRDVRLSRGEGKEDGPVLNTRGHCGHGLSLARADGGCGRSSKLTTEVAP